MRSKWSWGSLLMVEGFCAALALCAVLSYALSAFAQTPSSAVAYRARLLLSEGKADSAVVLLSDALKADSVDVGLLLTLADAQKAKRQPRARRATLEKVLRIQKRSVEARLAIAEDFFAAKQLDSAAFFANAALLNSSRRSAGAYYWLGRIHQQAGRADSALFYFGGACMLLPSGRLF